MCSSILSALGPSWVGSIIPEVTGIIFRFRLLWKAVDLLCKLLCKGAGLGTVRRLVHLATFSLTLLFGRCCLLIFITSDFKLRGSGETLAIWSPIFLPLWIGILFCYVLLCSIIWYYPLLYSVFVCSIWHHIIICSSLLYATTIYLLGLLPRFHYIIIVCYLICYHPLVYYMLCFSIICSGP